MGGGGAERGCNGSAVEASMEPLSTNTSLRADFSHCSGRTSVQTASEAQSESGALRAELPAVLAHTDGPSCVEDVQREQREPTSLCSLCFSPPSSGRVASGSHRPVGLGETRPQSPTPTVSGQSRLRRKSCTRTLCFPLTLHHTLTARFFSSSFESFMTLTFVPNGHKVVSGRYFCVN